MSTTAVFNRVDAQSAPAPAASISAGGPVDSASSAPAPPPAPGGSIPPPPPPARRHRSSTTTPSTGRTCTPAPARRLCHGAKRRPLFALFQDAGLWSPRRRRPHEDGAGGPRPQLPRVSWPCAACPLQPNRLTCALVGTPDAPAPPIGAAAPRSGAIPMMGNHTEGVSAVPSTVASAVQSSESDSDDSY